MADTNSVDLILDFLRRNRFTRAEAALRGELSNRPDLNGFLQKLTLEDKDSLGNSLEGENGDKPAVDNQVFSHNAGEVSKDVIVKEIQCGTGRNGSESKWKNAASTGERNKGNELAGTSDKGFTFYKGSENTVLDLYSWKFSSSNGTTNQYSGGDESAETRKTIAESGDDAGISGEKKTSWVGSSSKVVAEPKYDKTQISEPKVLDRQPKTSSSSYFKENFTDNLWSRSEEALNSSSDVWKDCSVKTVFPFPKVDVSTSNYGALASDKKEGKKKAEVTDVRAAIKEQVDEVGRALFLGKSQGSSEQKTISSLVFPLVSENQKEELPRLPPVKLKSEDRLLNVNWEEKYDRDGPGTKLSSTDNPLLIGSYLDVPVGQEINSAG